MENKHRIHTAKYWNNKYYQLWEKVLALRQENNKLKKMILGGRGATKDGGAFSLTGSKLLVS